MDRDQAKLFVGGISRDTSEDTLKDHFDKYGAVMGSVVAKDKTTKNPRGFGFVWFSDPSSADKALTDTHVIGGRTVEVKKAIPRNEQSKNQQLSNGMSMSDNNSNQIRTRKIFVGGLPTDLTEEDFKNYFERFGRVTDVVVMHDSMTHRPRGFGFITYDLEDSVENVMQNSFHELNGRLVEVKRAVPKEENNWNGNGYYVRNGSGRGSSGNVYPPGNYSPYGPRYAPNHAPAPYFVYNGYGSFYNGTGVYNGWYPGFDYGVAPIANGYGRGHGVRAGLFPYGNTSVYPAYMNGDVSAIDLAAVAWPGVNVKVNQVFLGIGRSQHSTEGGKQEANPLSDAASSKQD
ncbi:hypothetical protein FEM48_Zijuj06G0046600 [Ziziphus jujuba var. spinosa]|uniref:RRM domain-containing protein n=1 Tax=Ziziphus jujuba var. spinosa TaxID=714518 RepID=A0A978V778_ZIZJJ|nr:hypothetical protein FEM48_Zijuj06G0046600 [Ziziphus jujuba var. spinosa]